MTATIAFYDGCDDTREICDPETYSSTLYHYCLSSCSASSLCDQAERRLPMLQGMRLPTPKHAVMMSRYDCPLCKTGMLDLCCS